MAAVAIMGLVLVTLLGLRNRGVADVMLADHMTTATLLAKRLMLETVSGAKKLGEESGQYTEEEFKEYSWKKTISATQVPQLLEVRAAVLWKEAGRDEMVELVSYE